MPDDAKAKKLAAARKKLKAYQSKEKNSDVNVQEQIVQDVCGTDDARQVDTTETCTANESPAGIKASIPSSDISVASFSKSNASSFDSESASTNGNHVQQAMPIDNIEHFLNNSTDAAYSNTIELLVNEKASLCSELAHYKAESKEKALAAEEANVRLKDALKRNEELGKDVLNLQSHNSNLRNEVNKLTDMVSESCGMMEKLKHENIEMREHIDELKQEVQKGAEKYKILEDQIKEKDSELELNRIRINQISDVASVENDSKVEALTQTKFMHEQQIRDLQAMVQQLETERENSNQRYQSYVQHLNKDVKLLTERTAQLTEENSRLAERERGLVDHVGRLERQLQQMIAQQRKISTTNEEENQRLLAEEIDKRTKELSDEKQTLIDKINLQDVQLVDMQRLVDDKLAHIEKLESKIENFSSIQTDSAKLLTQIESSNVAASRAVEQNEMLKKQLDEVQTKLIEITNDKVELTNLLDAERFGNREIRMNYENLEQQVVSLAEKLHFKDEEMIRLMKENVELRTKVESLPISMSQHHVSKSSCEHGDLHEHDHDHGDHSNGHKEEDHSHDSAHNHTDSHPITEKQEDSHNHEHHDHIHEGHHDCQSSRTDSRTTLPVIQPNEAMEKLEARFKALMNDVASLTDEKQRLEHLVMQLQGETDTIGEYIALYQAQRRVLKQREIEKNTQLTKLKSEREELHNKLTLLNQLLNNLSQQVNVTNNSQRILGQQSNQLQPSNDIAVTGTDGSTLGNQTPFSGREQLNSNEIIHAIKNIVADIKNNESIDVDLNIVPALDHCSCCSGKFETI